jgi:hypothetical protein
MMLRADGKVMRLHDINLTYEISQVVKFVHPGLGFTGNYNHIILCTKYLNILKSMWTSIFANYKWW